MTAAATIALPATSGASSRAAPASRYGRVVSIDILRGLALLWVMTFHLWADVTLHLSRPLLYTTFRTSILHGHAYSALTRLGEIVLSDGNLGVQLFMMLSGISLTVNAYQRGEPSAIAGYAKRFRRVLPVYWFGLVFMLATLSALALIQARMDGGTFTAQWTRFHLTDFERIHIGWTGALLIFTVFAWPFRPGSAATPALVGSLWFVELLLAYYLLFPIALRIERRVGPWAFAALGIAVMIAARGAFIPWSDHGVGLDNTIRLLSTLAPFRLAEFTIGMSIGHLIAERRHDVIRWLRSPADAIGITLLGAALLTTGVLIAPKGDVAWIFSEAFVDVGLALMIAPLLFKAPGRLEHNLIARALVLVGVVSFTALITDDMMRWIAGLLRHEAAPQPVLWFFIVAIYVPVGVALAYPLAKLFGLLPSQRDRERNVPGGPPKPPSAAVRGTRRRTPRSTRRREARAARA